MFDIVLGFLKAAAPGAILVGAIWLGYLALTHGWGWVLAKVEAWWKSKKTEAASVTSRLSTVESDIKAIKTKIGL